MKEKKTAQGRYRLSNLLTAGNDGAGNWRERQRLVGKSSPYWTGLTPDSEEDKRGANTMEGMTEEYTKERRQRGEEERKRGE